MPKIEYKCQRCNQSFIDKACEKRKFCSRKCTNHRPLSKSAKEKISGSNHYLWKGDNAGYRSLHKRIIKIYGKANHCEICKLKIKNKVYHWANLTGNYANIFDYKQMCVPCHSKYDKKRRKNENGF